MISVRAPRPRLLLLLGFTAFFYGVTNMGTAWQTARALTGSADRFVSSMREVAGLVIGVPDTIGTEDERRHIAERKGQALWSRRGVLLPLAAATGIAAALITLGAMRAVARGGHRAGWGRQAWQLGALISVPCVALETVVAVLHSRDLVAAIADLHDPVADQVRLQAGLSESLSVGVGVFAVLYLLASARYLASRRVVEYCDAVSA